MTVVVTETPAAEPEANELIICQAAEPNSLYLYGSNMLAAQSVRHAIDENLYTQLAYDYHLQALAKLPSLADGDAVIDRSAIFMLLVYTFFLKVGDESDQCYTRFVNG